MSEVFGRDPVIFAYIKWHYGRGLREVFSAALNFLWFITNFFSFKILLQTLFAPWKRLGEKYEGGFDLGALAETVIVNTLMRAVGFVIKIVVLAVGLVTYVVTLSFFVGVLMIWMLAPAILLGCAVLSATFFVI